LFSVNFVTGILPDHPSEVLIIPSDFDFGVHSPRLEKTFPAAFPLTLVFPENRLPAGMAAATAAPFPGFPYLVLAGVISDQKEIRPAVFRKAVYYSLQVAEANQWTTVLISVPDFLEAGVSLADFGEHAAEMIRKFRQESGIVREVTLWSPDGNVLEALRKDFSARL